MTVVMENLSQTFHHVGGTWSRAALPTQLDSASTIVLACGMTGSHRDSGALHELRGAFRSSSIIGCSGGGTESTSAEHGSLQVAVCRFRKTRLSAASAPLRSVADSFRAGQLIGQQLTTPSLRAIMLFCDGSRTNGTQMLRGLQAVIDERVLVCGGLAGADRQTDKTWVLRDGVATDGFASAVGFYGQGLAIRQSASQPWRGIGPVRKVTRSRDNVVFELDGCPALDIYKSYIGNCQDRMTPLAARLPLQILHADGPSLRTVRGIDPAQHSIAFTADVPEGAAVQLAFAPSAMSTDGAARECGGFSGLTLTCIGQARLEWDAQHEQGATSLDGAEIMPSHNTALTARTQGEFARSHSGQLEMRGGSHTTTTIGEEA